jgi:hypothetical protein
MTGKRTTFVKQNLMLRFWITLRHIQSSMVQVNFCGTGPWKMFVNLDFFSRFLGSQSCFTAMASSTWCQFHKTFLLLMIQMQYTQ